MLGNTLAEGSSLSAAEFADLMAGYGPFEPEPTFAVGVSGGADSLAAMLLLKSWLKGRGGRLVALSVDHGLRADSRDEIAFVWKLCGRLGVEHQALAWRGARHARGGLQAAAREARYDLLVNACRERAILHLVLAHHLDDQAETFLLRLGRGSSLRGLSAMAPIRYHANLRILRPLLGVPGARLRATVVAHDLSWVEDPSNRDTRFGRVRMRRLVDSLVDGGPAPERIGLAARRLALYRREQEARAADLIARCVRIWPAGYGEICADPYFEEEVTVRELAISRLLAALGGRPYGPRAERLKRFHAKLSGLEAAVTTLARVRAARSGGKIRLTRESRHLPSEPLVPPGALRWDNRFDVRLAGTARIETRGNLRVAALGAAGWAALPQETRDFAKARLPVAACHSLPALWDDLGLISQPHLRYTRQNRMEDGVFSADFRPEWPITGLFTLV